MVKADVRAVGVAEDDAEKWNCTTLCDINQSGMLKDD